MVDISRETAAAAARRRELYRQTLDLELEAYTAAGEALTVASGSVVSVEGGGTLRSGGDASVPGDTVPLQPHPQPQQQQQQQQQQLRAQPIEGVPHYSVSIITADPVVTVVDHLMGRLSDASVELRERRLLREDLQVLFQRALLRKFRKQPFCTT